MARQIVLLRGINLGPRRRIPMPELRELLQNAGFEDVRTYVQSGNIVLSSDLPLDALQRNCEDSIADRFGFDVPVIVRTREDLERIVDLNPLADVAANPKRYQVTFLSGQVSGDVLPKLEALATDSERLVAAGREIYTWHPDGAARSKLWAQLAGTGLGVVTTSRNWTTVTTLLEWAREA
jgi:uncharacterized protein (DUF1697 family)